jgi:hypothetical protein
MNMKRLTDAPCYDPRMSIDDVWGHAQNVKMWMTTALQNLGAASNKKPGGFFANLLSGGRAGKARLDEAIDAIAKAKVAFIDLEFSLHRSGMEQVKLATMGLALVRQPDFGIGTFHINATAVKPIRVALSADLVTLDKLLADVEARQQAARKA